MVRRTVDFTQSVRAWRSAWQARLEVLAAQKNEDRPWTPTEVGSGTGLVAANITRS